MQMGSTCIRCQSSSLSVWISITHCKCFTLLTPSKDVRHSISHKDHIQTISICSYSPVFGYQSILLINEIFKYQVRVCTSLLKSINSSGYSLKQRNSIKRFAHTHSNKWPQLSGKQMHRHSNKHPVFAFTSTVHFIPAR